MASLTPTARRVAASPGLGDVVKVYGPPTMLNLLGAAIVIAIGAGASLATAALLGSDLVPADSNPLTSWIHPDTTLLQDQPAVAHYLPLAGLLFVLIGALAALSALRNASSRVVLCRHGIAMATRRTTGAFAWSEVSSVKRRSQTSASTGADGRTTFNVVRWYTVVRTYDGRTFVLDSRHIGGGARKLGRIVQKSVRGAHRVSR
ncbi:hypothetical protein ACEZCY_04730 [Streptacidiphilus sp. N1-12]|uniref:PH domain-containing protein n=2 Tax=Streptacidiphilus alkalitolerans TaxID=3342712 RepID=A0ABV6W8Z4_9ACTN